MEGPVLMWVIIIAVAALLVYKGVRRGMRETADKQDEVEGRYISEVGDKSTGVLACPVCGGTTFKAKRSAGAKVGLGLTIGLGALLAPKTRVRCETCGTEYLRG